MGREAKLEPERVSKPIFELKASIERHFPGSGLAAHASQLQNYATLAHDDSGLELEAPDELARQRLLDAATRLRWDLPPDFHDLVTEHSYAEAERVAQAVQKRGLALWTLA